MTTRVLSSAFVVLLASGSAFARPGLYISFGAGGSSPSGETDLGASRFGEDENGMPLQLSDGLRLSTDIDGGLSSLVRIGYNVMGYAALELMANVGGHDFTSSDERELGIHAHGGVRAYPLWHWRGYVPEYLQPLEPSLFLGLGTTYAVYKPSVQVGGQTIYAADPVGYSTFPSWRFGFGLEYFVSTMFKVGFDYFYTRATFDNFIYDFDEDVTFPIEPGAKTSFKEFFFTVALHVEPQGTPVRYERPASAAGPAAAAESEPEAEIVPKGPAAPAPAPNPSPSAPETTVIDG